MSKEQEVLKIPVDALLHLPAVVTDITDTYKNGHIHSVYLPTTDINGFEIASAGTAKATIDKLILQHKEIFNLFLDTLEELKKYKEIAKNIHKWQELIGLYENFYGKFVNPFVILQQLYLSGKVSGKTYIEIENEMNDKNSWRREKRRLLSSRKWKLYNTESKKFRDGVNLWLANFELWGILDSDANIRYANVTYEKAKKILKEKIEEINNDKSRA